MKNRKEYLKQYRRENSERIKKYKRQWRKNNLEHCNEYSKQWQKDNPEKAKKINKKWRENNPGKVKEFIKGYYIKNKIKINKYSKQYRINNPEYTKDYYRNHKEERNEKRKQYYQNNKEKENKQSEQWIKNNIIKYHENHKKYRQTHKKEKNEYCKNKRKVDLRFNLNEKIKSAMNISLKGNKKGRHWEDLVGYTLNDLIQHLQKTIPEGYAWQDFLEGGLHMDHIIPIDAFNFSEPEHIDFKRCWSLKNLRLLPAEENLKKSNKLMKPFQPSLRLRGKIDEQNIRNDFEKVIEREEEQEHGE